MFLANSSPNSSSWNEWNDPPFCIHCQNNSTSSPDLLDWPCNNLATLLHDWRHQFPYRKVIPNLVTLPTVWIFSRAFRRQRVLAVRADWFIWMWDHFVVCFLIKIYQSHKTYKITTLIQFAQYNKKLNCTRGNQASVSGPLYLAT